MPSKMVIEIAKQFQVSPRMIAYASKVQKQGIPEIKAAFHGGKLKTYTAARIVDFVPEDQKDLLSVILSGEAKTAEQAIAILTARRNIDGESGDEDREKLFSKLFEIERKICMLMDKKVQICTELGIDNEW